MGALAHSLIAGTMGVATHALQIAAGPKAPDSYSTDDSGKVTPNYSPDRSRDRIARIAQAALQGLAAGSQVRPQQSGAASALAGIEAGASNQMAREQQDDLLKRAQSKEQFEQEQQALTAKYVRAAHNATTYSLYRKAMDEKNDHDPERQRNMAIQAAAEDYISRNPSTSMTAQVMSESEARALQAADKNNPASVTHAFFPLGMQEAKENGQAVMDKDGITPKSEGQLLVIGGGTKDGKIPLPQAYVSDLKKYGKQAGITNIDRVQAGDEWGLDRFLNANARMNPIKGQEIDGWKQSSVITP